MASCAPCGPASRQLRPWSKPQASTTSRVRLVCRASGMRDPEPGKSHGATRRTYKAEAVPSCAEPLGSFTVLGDKVDLRSQLERLENFVARLHTAPSYTEKLEIVGSFPGTASFLSNSRDGREVARHLPHLSIRDAYLLLVLVPLGQRHVLHGVPTDPSGEDGFSGLLRSLSGVEAAYESLGGVAGYQLQCLRLLVQGTEENETGAVPGGAPHPVPGSLSVSGPGSDAPTPPRLLVPRGLRLHGSDEASRRDAAAAVAAGLRGVPRMAEVWPIGGCGDRLGLSCAVTGQGLPAALLRVAGRTLLETLVLDTTAREYLYWKVHARRGDANGDDVQHAGCVGATAHVSSTSATLPGLGSTPAASRLPGMDTPHTPIALMTSAAKGNHGRVEALCQSRGWFGRGRSGFKLFQQPLVPVVLAEDGRWMLTGPLRPAMKPGGHGVIWGLMLDAGVYGWLEGRGRGAITLRQISNPLAGTDDTMLALAGRGLTGRKSFGFASCERVVGAAEGVNVLACRDSPVGPRGEIHTTYAVSNVEYTEFARHGVQETLCESGSGHSAFPANANLIYVDLKAAESVVRGGMADQDVHALLPGLILNTSKRVAVCADGVTAAPSVAPGTMQRVQAGRLECTMQNLADCFAATLPAVPQDRSAADALPTFLVTNLRRKVTSSAKRAVQPGSTAIHQTPPGCFYDMQANAAELLTACGFDAPGPGPVAEYLAHGPELVFLFHPALGPLWSVVQQKLRGGRLARRSELQLDVAEADVEDLDLTGSLRVLADAVMGHLEPDWLAESEDGKAQVVCPQASTAADPSTHGILDPAPPQRLRFSDRCGRVRLSNVVVRNRGIDWDSPDNVYWSHAVARHECCRIVLKGHAEFEARDVVLDGDVSFEVPDGHRMTVTPAAAGALGHVVSLHPIATPTWTWDYSPGPDGTAIHLTRRCHAS